METFVSGLAVFNLEKTGTFCVFKENKFQLPINGSMSSGAILDFSGLIRFKDGLARTSSSSGVLIFIDKKGNELKSHDLTGIHESEQGMAFLKMIFGDNIERECIESALEGVLA